MIKMTYDHFEELCQKFDEMPDLFDNNEGFSEHDLEVIQKDPVRFLPVIMYYLSRDFPDDHVFSNEDAIPASEAKLEFNNLLKKIIEFVD